jgi:hypothetical protein
MRVVHEEVSVADCGDAVNKVEASQDEKQHARERNPPVPTVFITGLADIASRNLCFGSKPTVISPSVSVAGKRDMQVHATRG